MTEIRDHYFDPEIILTQYNPKYRYLQPNRPIIIFYTLDKVWRLFQNKNRTNQYIKAPLLVKCYVAMIQANHISGKNLVCLQKE